MYTLTYTLNRNSTLTGDISFSGHFKIFTLTKALLGPKSRPLRSTSKTICIFIQINRGIYQDRAQSFYAFVLFRAPMSEIIKEEVRQY